MRSNFVATPTLEYQGKQKPARLRKSAGFRLSRDRASFEVNGSATVSTRYFSANGGSVETSLSSLRGRSMYGWRATLTRTSFCGLPGVPQISVSS